MGSETLDIRCECGRVYHSSSEHIGRRIKCANCGRLVEVKAPPNPKPNRNIQTGSTVTQPMTGAPGAKKGRPFSRRGLWLALASAAILIAVALYSRKTYISNTRAITPNIATKESSSAHDSAQGSSVSHPEFQPTGTPGTPSGEDTSTGMNCPAISRSLSNGARLQPDVGTNGHGTLTVDNGTSDDATVELVNIGDDYTSRYAYIRANHKLKLTGVEAGTYHLLFTQGVNWVGDDFTCSPSYSEFEKELVYSESVEGNKHEFHEMSVTLQSVLLGNVKTKAISPADFHRHKQRVENSSQ
jgi:hypothetical protein